MTIKQPVGRITPTGQLFPLSSYRPEQKLAYDAHKAGWRHVVVADDEILTPSPTAHAAAAAFADGLPELAPSLQTQAQAVDQGEKALTH